MACDANKPNVLILTPDQLSIDAISAHGCADVKTPNIDRIVRRGVTFMQSYSTNPLCSPARSSIVTGRMTVETGVIQNERYIDSRLPTLGHCFSIGGYDSVYCGKWHLPFLFESDIPGFRVIPAGLANGQQACLSDPMVSRSCEAYLRNRAKDKPFLMFASFTHPHDICALTLKKEGLVPEKIPFQGIENQMPSLAPNHNARVPCPPQLTAHKLCDFSEEQWKYYNYVYYRMVEMADAEMGRVLDALEETGELDNTIILITSDHGESRGRHGMVAKWHPYDEAAKVPFIMSWPGRIPEGQVNDTHLVSGLDIMPTLCDLAGVAPAPTIQARSLRPLLAGDACDWRDYLVIELQHPGRAVRSNRYKYVDYAEDPQKQFFDMQEDPWELKNLWGLPEYASLVEDHRRMLAEWESRLERSETLLIAP